MRTLCPELTDDELAHFGRQLAVKTYRKKEYYTKSHEVQRYVGFVVSGLVRSFYVDSHGDEKTSWFVPENQFITDYPVFLEQRPSHYHFQCLEPTTIVNLPYEAIQQAYHTSSRFERYGRLIAEEILKLQQTRIESFLFKNAEQRYLDFIRDSPELFNRISLTYLASYLGIERQSLSRIRKKLMTQ